MQLMHKTGKCTLCSRRHLCQVGYPTNPRYTASYCQSIKYDNIDVIYNCLLAGHAYVAVRLLCRVQSNHPLSYNDRVRITIISLHNHIRPPQRRWLFNRQRSSCSSRSSSRPESFTTAVHHVWTIRTCIRRRHISRLWPVFPVLRLC